MNVLPRYHPTPPNKPAGCAAHDNPDCLCDVVVTSPAPIYRGEHKYHQMALDELDDYGVNERNIYEFMQIVLALHSAEQMMALEDRAMTNKFMTQFPQEIQDALQVHLRGLSHWTTAVHELPAGADIKGFAKAYPVTASSYRHRHYNGIVTERVKQTVEEVDHGSHGGIRWHRRTGDPVCDECRLFFNEYTRKLRARKRAERAASAAEYV